MLENISGHSNSSHLMVFVMFKGLQPSTISICNLLLPTDSKVFDRNKNSSALNSGPCASIVSCPPHKYKHTMAGNWNMLYFKLTFLDLENNNLVHGETISNIQAFQVYFS